MSEELIQRGLDKKNPTSKIGKWNYYCIGSTTLKALRIADIIRNVDYGSLELKKVDGIIVNNKDVIAIIEFKQPKEFKTSKQKDKAIAQEIEVAKILGSKIIIATDRIDTVWVNALTGQKICSEDSNPIITAFNPSDENIAALIEKINYSINEKNNNILPKQLVNPTDLATSIWQDVWSASGESPTGSLYTFVELFIFKYLSDLNTLQGIFSFQNLMNNYTKNNEDDMLEFYANTIRPRIKSLFPESDTDNTTIINGSVFVNKLGKPDKRYSIVFKKVLEKFANYGRLEHIDYDFKSQLFESFLKESISKKNLGQFFTPMKVIHAINEMVKDEVKEGAIICDPACGVGKFLLEPIKSRLSQFYKVEGENVIPKITIRGFDKGFDGEEQKTIILAKANMLIYFSEIIKDYPNHTVKFGKIFNETFTLKTNSILGTLRDPIENEYDLILTNPPYVTSGSSNLKDEITKDLELKKYYKINAIGVEGLFMEWIIRALKPNGKAFVVVPDGIFNRQNDKNLREFIKQECFIDGIISLPLNTFFTTNKKTYILCLTKKNNKSDIQCDPVFTYLVSEIGESRDIYRFNIEQNDLSEATKLYNFFKGNKPNFGEFNKDPRCKIFSIDKFMPDAHWSVDRWWNKEEKIALGIEEEDKAVSFEEVPMIVEEIADTLNSIGAMIKELSEKKKSDLDSVFKEVKISDIFVTLPIPKKLNKSDLHEQKGFPVYSSQFEQDGLIGNYPSSMFKASTSDPLLTFGDHTKAIFIRYNNFSVLDNVKVLYPLKKDILIEYVIHIWKQKIPNLGYSRHWKEAKNIIFSIPILPNGDFDIEVQQNIVERFNIINDLKTKVSEYKQTIKTLIVKIDDELENFTEVKIGDIFEIKKGLSKYTKTYGKEHTGIYPVYSASNIAPLTYINSYDYDGKYITWATNGFAGYVKVIDCKFSANGDRGILISKVLNIDLDYVKFILEPKLRILAKGRKGDKGEDEFTKVYPSMVEHCMIKIPTLLNGDFDIKTQKVLAHKYMTIEQLKVSMEEELTKIEKLMVTF